MLDKDGKITRLIVKTAEDMETLYDIARDDKKYLNQSLKNWKIVKDWYIFLIKKAN